MIKNLIKTSPFLYYLWFELYRKNRGGKIDYFSHKTKYLLDGYPRSGNTFAINLVANTFGRESVCHHFHAIAPIKIALNKKLPVFILIRNPEDAITSNYLKEYSFKKIDIPDQVNMPLLKQLAEEYVEYYHFVKKVRNKLVLIKFKMLIAAPGDFLNTLNSMVFNNAKTITEKDVEAAVGAYRGASDIIGSSKPNEVKERLKDKLKEELFKLKSYNEAKILFEELN